MSENINAKANPADVYPGVAVDVADDEKVTKEEVIAETKELNNNPRNDDM